MLNNTSIVKFERDKNGHSLVGKNFKILSREVKQDKNFWMVRASHDAYSESNGVIHEREIKYFHESTKLQGYDKLLKIKKFRPGNFELRFHFLPEIKLTKLLNNETILIESSNTGWKFTCKNNNIDIETGLYFGIKNRYLENKNIVISGLTNSEEQRIFWELSKV